MKTNDFGAADKLAMRLAIEAITKLDARNGIGLAQRTSAVQNAIREGMEAVEADVTTAHEEGYQEGYEEGLSEGRSDARGAYRGVFRFMYRWLNDRGLIFDDGEGIGAQDVADGLALYKTDGLAIERQTTADAIARAEKAEAILRAQRTAREAAERERDEARRLAETFATIAREKEADAFASERHLAEVEEWAREDGIRAAISLVEKLANEHARECGIYDYTTNVVEFDGAAEDVDIAYQDTLRELAALRAKPEAQAIVQETASSRDAPPEGYVVMYGIHRSWHAYYHGKVISRWAYKADAIKACWDHAALAEAQAVGGKEAGE